MHKLLLEFPMRMETERLVLRGYQAGDGPGYYRMSQKNQLHLARYESGNAVMSIHNEEEAEIAVRDFAADWVSRRAFFWGVFAETTQEFAAQISIGVGTWDLPEFEIGYFADVEHEGQGYVTEAVEAALHFIFVHLGAQRVHLECDDTNPRSWRAAERCGMVRAGTSARTRNMQMGRSVARCTTDCCGASSWRRNRDACDSFPFV